jgi:hypothetical protein
MAGRLHPRSAQHLRPRSVSSPLPTSHVTDARAFCSRRRSRAIRRSVTRSAGIPGISSTGRGGTSLRHAARHITQTKDVASDANRYSTLLEDILGLHDDRNRITTRVRTHIAVRANTTYSGNFEAALVRIAR